MSCVPWIHIAKLVGAAVMNNGTQCLCYQLAGWLCCLLLRWAWGVPLGFILPLLLIIIIWWWWEDGWTPLLDSPTVFTVVPLVSLNHLFVCCKGDNLRPVPLARPLVFTPSVSSKGGNTTQCKPLTTRNISFPNTQSFSLCKVMGYEPAFCLQHDSPGELGEPNTRVGRFLNSRWSIQWQHQQPTPHQCKQCMWLVLGKWNGCCCQNLWHLSSYYCKIEEELPSHAQCPLNSGGHWWAHWCMLPPSLWSACSLSWLLLLLLSFFDSLSYHCCQCRPQLII